MYTYNQLLNFANQVFLKMGCSAADADTAARTLVSADLRGVDSHGVARLCGYVRLWDIGRINPTPDIRITHETPSTAVVDGDGGLGLVVGPKAMGIAMAKAVEVGTGWVAVNNSSHFGIAGCHSMQALEQDMIGICMTNASPLVAPTWSKEPLLGTNPIAVAIPAGEEPPFVTDFATTTAAYGKLEILQRKKEDAPLGWIQDKDGRPSTNSFELKDGGSLLPLGSDREHGSHKGYCLASIVDIFSAVLSGANYGPWVPPFVGFLPVTDDMPGKGIGHFFGALRVDAFQPKDQFKSQMDNWIKQFRRATPVDEQDAVLIPGDPERMIAEERINSGFDILRPVENDLKALAEKFEIEI